MTRSCGCQCCSCATGINLAFEGVDANSAAFTTASQVKKLTSYSLVSIYFKAKEAFLDTVSSRQLQSDVAAQFAT
jgi:hypothetical protein